MKEILNSVIEKLFDAIPFSKNEELLRQKITNYIVQRYDSQIDGENEIARAGQLMLECNDLNAVCEAAGCEEQSYAQCAKADEAKNKSETHKLLRRIREYIYLQSLCMAVIFGLILISVCSYTVKTLVQNGIIVLFFLAILLAVTRCKRKYLIDCQYEEMSFDRAGRTLIYNDNDRYSKKLMNTFMLGVGALAYVISVLILGIVTYAYSAVDVLQQITHLSVILEVIAFFLIKNYLCKCLSDVFFIPEKAAQYRKHITRVLSSAALYFGMTLLLLFLLRKRIDYFFNWILVLELTYSILCGIHNLTLRKNVVFQNIAVNIKRIIAISLMVVMVLSYNLMSMELYLTQPYINTVSKVLVQEDKIDYNEENGVYTITTEKEDFRILQLTDIHLGGSFLSVAKDTKALEACNKLIHATRPDLVVVTGDLVFPMGVMSFSFNNSAPVMQFANFMRNTGIPWAFTYGNHDTESMATLDRDKFDALMKSLSYKSSGNLLYPYIQPDIYGRSNQMIEIRNADGSLKQAVFLIDSNDYIEGAESINEYDYIHDDQVEWYKKNVQRLSEEEGYTIPSTVFFHIPLREYKEANDLYEAGSDKVRYYYGAIGEKMIDKICCSKYESKLFDTAVELGSTKAMFCGHDHYNNESLEYKGIRLTYGYSIDYLAMPGIENDTEQRGATLITIDHEGGLAIEPYRLMDLSESKNHTSYVYLMTVYDKRNM